MVEVYVIENGSEEGGTSGKSIMAETVIPVGGYPAIIGGNQSGYLRLFQGTLAISSIEAYNKVRLPACKVQYIRGRASDHGSDLTLTIRKNGVDTTLTGTISADGLISFTGSGPIDFSDGDEMSISFSTAAGGGCAVTGLVGGIRPEVIA